MNKDLIVILARQRSGTGALGSVLDSHPDVVYVGEIFHPQNVDTDQNNYFYYLKNISSKYKAIGQVFNPYEIFSEYVNYLKSIVDCKKVVVDVKYRSMHHLNGPWHGILDTPKFLQFCLSENIPIIHLLRNNLLQTFVSGVLAEKNQQWHVSDKKFIKAHETILEIRKLCNYLVYTKAEVEQVQKWIHGYKNKLVLEYAKTFQTDGVLDPNIGSLLSNFLNIEKFESLKPAFVKQVCGTMRDVIENFAIVEYALRGTDFHWMCED